MYYQTDQSEEDERGGRGMQEAPDRKEIRTEFSSVNLK
jgi:hypothetical protein